MELTMTEKAIVHIMKELGCSLDQVKAVVLMLDTPELLEEYFKILLFHSDLTSQEMIAAALSILPAEEDDNVEKESNSI